MWIFYKPFLNFVFRVWRNLLSNLGAFLFIMLVLSFTSLPFWADYHLGVAAKPLDREPDVIVVLGGSGMPSANGLMRTYYGAEAALKFPLAKIIIALPGDTMSAGSSIKLMAKEMILRGVDSTRIIFENEGTNTRAEALLIKKRFFPNNSPQMLIVTTPSHMYRSVKTFRKVGFENVGGLPSFGRANETSLYFSSKDLGGNQYVPDVGNNISIRYRIWTHLQIEISVIREYFAIAYYWMMDWI